jgi:hypothetical protein
MGKRSTFDRREGDFYPTPRSAVLPLIPWLRGVRTFAEPCCGDGALVRHLESFGLRCAYAGDIATGQDALALDQYGGAQVVIAKPYTRPPSSPPIWHFARILPTWLLLETDWPPPSRPRLLFRHVKHPSVGRLRWIEGTTMSGKQNFAWYRFDARHSAGPIFDAHGSVPVSSHATLCGQCGEPYRPQRSDARFCSDTCRQRAHRGRLAQAAASRDKA